MAWVNIIKAQGIARIKSIYPNILTFSRFRGICLSSKSYFSVINKTTVASCLEANKKALLVYDLHALDFSDCYPYNYSTCI